jgi:hypothetical protein
MIRQFWTHNIPSAASHPHKLIVVIGMWLVFGPLFIGTLGYAAWYVSNALPEFTFGALPASRFAIYTAYFLPDLFGVVVFGALLAKTTYNYCRVRQ